jgi:peptide/nickel transport system substrate-binding protein
VFGFRQEEEHMAENPKVSRRTLVKAGAAGAAVAAATPIVGKSGASAQDLREIPRNRTLILRWGGEGGRYVDVRLWNPYLPANSHQDGPGILHEPLAYYSAFADEWHPWLAESWEYNEDYTELRIKTREGVTWSDGTPFSAEDVAYTLTAAAEFGPAIDWGPEIAKFMESAVAEDANNVLVTFKFPAPRFFFRASYKFDIGYYIVPKHIFEGQDWATFEFFDLEAGLPITTGPWQVVLDSEEQRIIDRRDSWWAVDQGLVAAMPEVERIIYLPRVPDEQMAQQLIANEVDCSLDLRAFTMEAVLAQNPNITTHTGSEKPYGYVDWWPTSLYVNNEREPYTDPAVRWALSYYIDRDQVIEIGLGGAGTKWPLPLPSYPPLQPFIDAVADLLVEYPTLEYNPEKGDELLTGAGWAKNGDGMWEKDGTVLAVPIESYENLMTDIGPIIVQQLQNAGVESSYVEPPDLADRFEPGDFNGVLFGHGGSVANDPYDTLALYTSGSENIPGGHAVNFSRWNNAEFDAIVDEMAFTSPDETDKIMDQWLRAMAIWLPELPDIPIQEWYHRIPMNQTYWTGWPTQENAYVNGAFWHLTFQLVLNNLKAAQ